MVQSLIWNPTEELFTTKWWNSSILSFLRWDYTRFTQAVSDSSMELPCNTAKNLILTSRIKNQLKQALHKRKNLHTLITLKKTAKIYFILLAYQLSTETLETPNWHIKRGSFPTKRNIDDVCNFSVSRSR